MVGTGRNHTMLEANPSVFQPCLSPTPVAHLAPVGCRASLKERTRAKPKMRIRPIGPVKRRSPAAQCRPPNAQINAESGPARQAAIARGNVPFHLRAVIGPTMHARNLGSRPSRSHPGAPLPTGQALAGLPPLLVVRPPGRASRLPDRGGRLSTRRAGMEVFTQQLINGITLGSIYGLIAIGYTMVFGIIGMVNFAHGDVFMVSAFIALVTLLLLTTWLGIGSFVIALLIVLIVAMLFTSLVNWAIERVAYRPLRGSFRLAPLISAIGMSIFLSNFVQVAQGPRVKSIPPFFNEVIVLMSGNGYDVAISYKQIVVWIVTAALLLVFWFVVTKTALGRAQRACEQDQKMAALLGIDVDRTVSITFVIAAALAAVAGTMYLMYYGVVSFADGFVPGVKAFTAAVLGGIGSLPGAVLGGLLIGLIETMWSA